MPQETAVCSIILCIYLAVSGRHEEIKRLAHELLPDEERQELADEVARLRCRLQEQGR
jgi:hypothetical protein